MFWVSCLSHVGVSTYSKIQTPFSYILLLLIAPTFLLQWCSWYSFSVLFYLFFFSSDISSFPSFLPYWYLFTRKTVSPLSISFTNSLQRIWSGWLGCTYRWRRTANWEVERRGNPKVLSPCMNAPHYWIHPCSNEINISKLHTEIITCLYCHYNHTHYMVPVEIWPRRSCHSWGGQNPGRTHRHVFGWAGPASLAEPKAPPHLHQCPEERYTQRCLARVRWRREK